MSQQQQQQQQQKRQRRKGNDKEDGEWKCLDCCKSYLSYPAFYTHCKTKHDSKWPSYYNTPRPLEEIKRDKGRPRTNQDEQKQHEKEDQIFEFLGKLGQNNEEEESQNNCIRHYLKQPINPVTSINSEIFTGKEQEDFYEEIIKYLEQLNQKVVEQEQIWDFRDPLSLTNEYEEFTFSNLKGMFYQLEQDKKINLVSVVSLFLGWVSRHLKKKAYQDIVIIVIISAYFMNNFQKLSSKVNEPRDRINLMKLEQTSSQDECKQQQPNPSSIKSDQKSEGVVAEVHNEHEEMDIKQTTITYAALYLESKFQQFESYISYLKASDLAQGFISLFIDWIDVFSDLDSLLDKNIEKNLEKNIEMNVDRSSLEMSFDKNLEILEK